MSSTKYLCCNRGHVQYRIKNELGFILDVIQYRHKRLNIHTDSNLNLPYILLHVSCTTRVALVTVSEKSLGHFAVWCLFIYIIIFLIHFFVCLSFLWFNQSLNPTSGWHSLRSKAAVIHTCWSAAFTAFTPETSQWHGCRTERWWQMTWQPLALCPTATGFTRFTPIWILRPSLDRSSPVRWNMPASRNPDFMSGVRLF